MADINNRRDAKFRWMLPRDSRVSEGYVLDPPGSFNPTNRVDNGARGRGDVPQRVIEERPSDIYHGRRTY